jgi:hypothetical protein
LPSGNGRITELRVRDGNLWQRRDEVRTGCGGNQIDVGNRATFPIVRARPVLLSRELRRFRRSQRDLGRRRNAG